MPLTLKIAKRYLTSGQNDKFITLTAWLALLGIIIGVSALIIVMSVMSGFRKQLVGNIVGLSGEITISARGGYIENSDQILNILNKHEFIVKTRPIATGQGLASSQYSSQAILIKSMQDEDIKDILSNSSNAVRGSISDILQKSEIAIGSELAWNLNLRAGDMVTITALGQVKSIFGNIPRAKKFKVGVIFSTGMHSYDSSIVIIPANIGKKLLMVKDFNEIEIYTDSKINAIDYTKTITKILTENNIYDLRAISWMETNAAFLDALKIERVAMFTILSLIIIVAGFNIISSLFMLVRSRAKDIAILRTIGFSKKQIAAIFINCGMILGIIGTAGGVALGTILSLNIENIRIFLENLTGYKIFDAAIYFLYNLPVDLDIHNIISIATLSLVMSSLATIYPAWRAAKLNPVDNLRYE